VRRSLPALIALALVAGAALAGCSTDTVGEPSACTVKSGSGSESIRATGAFGKDPHAKVPAPLHVTRTQASTLIKGDGKVVGKGGVAVLSLTFVEGSTGQRADTAVNYTPITAKAIGSGLTDALGCARVGSRLAVVIPPKAGASMFGVQQGDSLVAIADIERALPARATGSRRTATPGFPTVVLAPNGQPGIVLGDRSQPKKVESAVLRAGDGAAAKKSDTLIVQTQTVSWSDPSTASGTWESGTPSTQTLSDGSALSKRLVGQRVGSQLIVLLPASASQSGSAEATVVDILGRVPARGAQQ
jgi:peptidylprolyl isomerase